MGRRFEMKKIEDNLKCQVTYSKRRNNLLKKAEELSICCEVDIAVLSFSPSGRVTEFCTFGSIQDMLARYVDLPPEKRLSHIKDIQGKILKLKELDHIKNDDHKNQYLSDQIENIELQIQKKQLEVQIAESYLRNFELDPDHESSLQKLSWYEKNIRQALEKLKGDLKGKTVNENEDEIPDNENNHSSQEGVDPWMKDPNMKTPKNLFKEILDMGRGNVEANAYGAASETALYNTTSNFPVPFWDPMHNSGVIVPEAQQSYGLFKINAGQGFPQEYPQHNYGYDMAISQVWQQTQIPWQQVAPNSSFAALVGESSNSMQNYQSALTQSSNSVTGNFVEANSYAWTSPGQSLNPVQITNQPNMVFNDMQGVHHYGHGNNSINDYESDGISDEMIISPSPSN